MKHCGLLRRGVGESTMVTRRERLKKLLTLKAPDIILVSAAETYLRCFRFSWRFTWQDFKLRRLPNWLLWLIDADFRAVCRDSDFEFEKDLREKIFGEGGKQP